MRRSDREVTGFSEILGIINRCDVLRLGLVDGARPYIVPLNFGVEVQDNQGLAFYFHSASAGRKIDILSKNPEVCFEMDCAVRIVPPKDAAQGCEWTAHYESVMGEGTVTRVEDPPQKRHALELLLRQCGHTGEAPVLAESVLERTSVFKLQVRQISAKRNA